MAIHAEWECITQGAKVGRVIKIEQNIASLPASTFGSAVEVSLTPYKFLKDPIAIPSSKGWLETVSVGADKTKLWATPFNATGAAHSGVICCLIIELL